MNFGELWMKIEPMAAPRNLIDRCRTWLCIERGWVMTHYLNTHIFAIHKFSSFHQILTIGANCLIFFLLKSWIAWAISNEEFVLSFCSPGAGGFPKVESWKFHRFPINAYYCHKKQVFFKSSDCIWLKIGMNLLPTLIRQYCNVWSHWPVYIS